MSTVTSSDGTRVAYEINGSGPPLLLIDGAFCSRAFGPMRELSSLLSARFSVVTFDRRGRGQSDDTTPYAVERELEDLQAIAGAIDQPLYVYGTSSGAVLAARAVAAGLPTKKLALHEPPLYLDGTCYPSPPDFQQQIADHLAAGRRSDAVKLFLRVVGVPSFGVFFMRLIPGVWRNLEAAAHTLPYDFAVLGDTQRGGPMPDELTSCLGAIRVPTAVFVGGKSPDYLHHAAQQVAELIPGSTQRVLPRQTHNVSAKAVAPVLNEHFC